jgi:3-hydroxyacyl-CoA dehydrogenase/enoyl-CoA hydratase/3-hydroxybutyryl-CoA epimerase
MADNVTLKVDSDGIATINWDMPGRSMNVMNDGSLGDFVACLDKVFADDAIKGVIVTSGKKDFVAGADLEMIQRMAFGPKDAKALTENAAHFQKILRRMETGGKPFVAAINGTALGGGLEICLACHYRIAADNPRAQLGLPEVKVGLLPGAGGTQRLPRMIGPQAALPLILEGKSLDPKAALAAKIVDEVVPADDLLAAAKRYLMGTPKKVQPWDEKNFKLPGGPVHGPGGAQVFTIGNAMLHKQSKGNYPAPKAIMSCVYEGLQVPIEAGLRIETRYFVSLLLGPVAGNMVRSLFINVQEANKLASRPKDVPRSDAKKITVLGAGMMGAGIAYVSAMAGIEVVLIDTEQASAEKGKAYSQDLLDKAVAKGRMAPEKRDQVLGLIKPTTDYAHVAGSDLVIEAVFETREIKADVTRKAEAQLGADAIFGSNTSTLPITGLAEASVRPENFIGIHFFSPVDKMPLVEIIMGKKTSAVAKARAMDYVQKIKKTPIVVNDSRGFYTSRCFGTYVSEGIEMLAEGIAPAIIDNVGAATGMPRGPLELSDDVALDLAHKVRTQTAKDLGDKYVATAADPLIAKMVTELGRFGRKNRKGFYDYPESGPKRLWPGLAEIVPQKVTEGSPELIEEIRKRLLYRQAVEAARCMEEGVVTAPEDADVGAILGWGFAPWTGGPISLIDTVGVAKFVEECDRLAQKYGARFAPPKLLRDMAARGETFHKTPGAKAAAE